MQLLVSSHNYTKDDYTKIFECLRDIYKNHGGYTSKAIQIHYLDKINELENKKLQETFYTYIKDNTLTHHLLLEYFPRKHWHSYTDNESKLKDKLLSRTIDIDIHMTEIQNCNLNSHEKEVAVKSFIDSYDMEIADLLVKVLKEL